MAIALVAASQFYQYRELERELNKFLVVLEHDKSGSETKRELAPLTKRMAAKREDFESFMSKVPNVPPLQGDEIQKKKINKG